MIQIVKEIVYALRDVALEEISLKYPEVKDKIEGITGLIERSKSDNKPFDFEHDGVYVRIQYTYDSESNDNRFVILGKDGYEVIFTVKFNKGDVMSTSISVVHERNFNLIYSVDNMTHTSAVKHARKEIKKLLNDE